MPLSEPFIVYATQNPIEHEGTYPLPEAQLDRFFFNLLIDYPTVEQERQIVLRTTGRETAEVRSVVGPADVLALQSGSGEIYNLGSGVGVSINTIFNALKQITCADCKEQHGPAKLGEVFKIYVNASKAAAGLKWASDTSLEEGLQKTVNYFRQVCA